MSSSDPYLGKSLGSFQVEKQLGAGAMGVVYLAVHETTQKKVAIKILPQEAGIKGQVTERFHREANLLQQFKHPNIVRFQAFGRTKGTLYVAMELVEGGTLSDLISKDAPLDWRTASKIAV
ncbi:MAG: Serine/threonine-protein kinase, partial [Planctomycetota bacterium]